jgi:DNA-directed RNA polymerase subunit M/transcription elongation factor TFIIS
MNPLAFCSKNPEREELSKPWRIGEWNYASNGIIVVRWKGDTYCESNPFSPDRADAMFDSAQNRVITKVPVPVTADGMKTCPECAGTKQVYICNRCHGEGLIMAECSECEHSYNKPCPSCNNMVLTTESINSTSQPCRVCNATGRIRDTDVWTQIGKARVAHYSLHLIKQEIPDAWIEDAQLDDGPVQFGSADGTIEGLVMPLFRWRAVK